MEEKRIVKVARTFLPCRLSYLAQPRRTNPKPYTAKVIVRGCDGSLFLSDVRLGSARGPLELRGKRWLGLLDQLPGFAHASEVVLAGCRRRRRLNPKA